MKLPSGTSIECVSLWNRRQWFYIFKPHNWFAYKPDRVVSMVTLLGFHIWIYKP